MKTKEELPACPVATAVSLIGGKWKLLILRNLRMRPWRFNELQKSLEGISQKVLTESLRSMEADGIIVRFHSHRGIIFIGHCSLSFHLKGLPGIS